MVDEDDDTLVFPNAVFVDSVVWTVLTGPEFRFNWLNLSSTGNIFSTLEEKERRWKRKSAYGVSVQQRRLPVRFSLSLQENHYKIIV